MIRIIAITVAAGALLVILFLLFSKSQKPWSEMTNEEQKKKKMIMTGSLTVFLAGLISALLTGKKK